MKINLEVNKNQIENDFKRIAEDLMNNFLLECGTNHYRITEIEFYFKDNGHVDDYTHAHELQKETGKWYFHGSGLDLTFGSEGSFGGILIRAIFNIESKEYIYGPLNCITEIFKNINDLYNPNFSFGLVASQNNSLNIEKPIAAPRVGLNPLKNKDMYDALYRFLIMPKEKHTNKTTIAEAMKKQNYSEEEIKNIWK